MAPGAPDGPALPPVTIKALVTLCIKRTRDMFAGDANKPIPLDEGRCYFSISLCPHVTPPPPPPQLCGAPGPKWACFQRAPF